MVPKGIKYHFKINLQEKSATDEEIKLKIAMKN